jgi:hypothetical protein
MKSFYILLIFLFSTISYGQSSYNSYKGNKLHPTPIESKWFDNGDNQDLYAEKLTTVGLKNVYYKLQDVLSYYNLEFERPTENKGIFASNIKSHTEFEKIALSCKSLNSDINMIWVTKDYIIIYRVTDEFASVIIAKIFK